ncbi:MAG: FeoB-associated Cys-rich membrane protein [Bacteroidales bacterium]|nr:FeoB-associated Cys-rich membrane protein [Bacteroidales bacterium]
MYNIIQWIIVYVAVAACVIYVILKIIKYARRKDPPCNCGCSSCPASKHCKDPKNQK